jgi:hypothetical protein
VSVDDLDLRPPAATTPFAVRLRPVDAATLARIARKHGLGPHALARRVLEAYLRKHGEDT